MTIDRDKVFHIPVEDATTHDAQRKLIKNSWWIVERVNDVDCLVGWKSKDHVIPQCNIHRGAAYLTRDKVYPDATVKKISKVWWQHEAAPEINIVEEEEEDES